MKTVKILHRTILAGLLASPILGGKTLLGMDSCTILDSPDEETHKLPELNRTMPDE